LTLATGTISTTWKFDPILVKHINEWSHVIDNQLFSKRMQKDGMFHPVNPNLRSQLVQVFNRFLRIRCIKIGSDAFAEISIDRCATY